METMIVGSGGREHALALACQQGDVELSFSQANAGMEQLGENLEITRVEDIVVAASERQTDLVIVGPEAPLAAGLADGLRIGNIPVLGVDARTAQLESSKIFAAEFMEEHGILTPDSYVADTPQDARRYIKGRKAPEYVIKADGLASGKGVILPKAKKQATRTVREMMNGDMFGEAGRRVLFQDRLSGEEVSMIALTDGDKAKVLFLAQDYKRLRSKDKGPNTGGMGSYAPVPPEIASQQQVEKMYETLEKTLDGLNRRGISSPGVLYIGFMLADQFDGDPAVMEYNVRFGDPETQAGLTILEDSGVNVHDLMYQAARGSLEGDRISTVRQPGRVAVSVCLAARGYPKDTQIGEPIYNLNTKYPDVTVHHGATKYREEEGQRTFTDGGRVLYVTGIGGTIKEARKAAYNAIEDDGLYFDGMQFRKDIGKRAIKAVKRAEKAKLEAISWRL